MKTPKLIEDLGQLYPRTTSLRTAHFGIFECPFCKNHFKTQSYGVKKGTTKSCGCFQRSETSKNHTTHGMSTTHIYQCLASNEKKMS